jgi:hypothetical protein
MSTEGHGRTRETTARPPTFDGAQHVASERPKASGRVGDVATWLRSFAVSRELVWLLVAAGAILRVRQYLANRSLWLDESFLAINLIEHPLEKLFGPLQFNQAAPAGFLVVEKAALLAGKSEYVLRAFPLICGLATLPLFVGLARRLLAPVVVPVAVLLFALCGSLIYYSSELKPYIVDVAATLALYLIGLSLADGRRDRWYLVAAAVIGAIMIQISYVGIFVAACLGAILLAQQALRKDWRDLRLLTFALAPWAFSALVFVWLSSRRLAQYTFEGDVFAKAPTSIGHVSWWTVPVRDLSAVAGLYHTSHNAAVLLTPLAGLLVFIGALALFRQQRVRFLILATPVLPMLVASDVHKYPLLPRTLLFLVPLVFVLVVQGTVAAVRPLGHTAPFAIAALAVALTGYQLETATRGIANPTTPENMKWELRYVAQHWLPGDVLYLHYPTQFAFTYYSECGCFSMPKASGRPLWPVRRAPVARPSVQMPRALVPENQNVLVGVFAGKYHKGIYRGDAERLARRKRAWLLFTFVVSEKERRFIAGDLLRRLDQQGRRLLHLHRSTADIDLYAFPRR